MHARMILHFWALHPHLEDDWLDACTGWEVGCSQLHQSHDDNEDEGQEGSGSTSPLNDSVLSDVSYGVDVCNRFACLLVEPTPDDCADPTIRSDCPDSSCINSSCLTPQLYISPTISLSSNSSSVPSSHGSHPVMEKEGQMHADNKRQIEKAKTRNVVEEYVYGMKDKLESVYKEFISEQDKEQFLRLLNDTEAWLYEEGDDETKTVYNKKLEELKKHGDPIFKRVKEFEGRSAAFDHLGAIVVRHDGKLTQYKAGNEELAHIAAEEMQKVEEAVHTKQQQQWMHKQLQKFENLPKSADPPITIAQILAEAKLLSTTCDSIVNKPKLKVELPKDETKQDGDNKQDEER